jgi:hypothetical protein
VSKLKIVAFVVGGAVVLAAGVVLVLPYSLNRKWVTYEAGAAGALRDLNRLEKAYSESRSDKSYVCDLSRLPYASTPVSPYADLVSRQGGAYGGYRFAFGRCEADADGIVRHYQLVAWPREQSVTGLHAFCTDETGEIFSDPDGSTTKCLAARRRLD